MTNNTILLIILSAIISGIYLKRKIKMSEKPSCVRIAAKDFTLNGIFGR